MSVQIDAYGAADYAGVMSVILPIQREEYGIAITEQDQPDLKAIPDFYQSGRGGFCVARVGDELVGTIGLKDIGNGQAALRKMFVSQNYRGGAHGIGAKLLSRLIAEAKTSGISQIFLGTTDKFLAAHRFYEKHEFIEISRNKLPKAFPVMAVDSKFYARMLN